jgi:hypothetical protein
MIRKIKEFGPKLEAAGFGRPKVLVDAEIEINQTWSENDVAPGIPGPPRRDIGRECVYVKPFCGGPWPSIDVLAWNNIWTKRVRVSIVAEA